MHQHNSSRLLVKFAVLLQIPGCNTWHRQNQFGFFFLFNFIQLIQISFQTAKQLLNLGMYFVLYFTSF